MIQHDDIDAFRLKLFDAVTAVEPQSTANRSVAGNCFKQFSTPDWLSP